MLLEFQEASTGFSQSFIYHDCSNITKFPEISGNLNTLIFDWEFYRRDGTLIKELQELPPSLNSLAANGCESLEIISTSTLGDSGRQLSCANCFKLDQKALMADMQLKIQFGNIRNSFQMVLPGSEIPEWFCDHSMGSSTTIQFPSNPLKLKAIALCFVFDCSYTPFHPSFCWQAKIKNGEHNDVICRKRYPWIYFEAMPSKYSGHEVTVEFHIGELGDMAISKGKGLSPDEIAATYSIPVKGPGWEVVIPTASGGMLSTLNSYIVGEESENPRKRSRLVDPDDIYQVLKKRKKAKAVKGICLDMPEAMEMQLESDAFAGMPSLEFLIIKGKTSKVELPHCGLEYLPNRLRYFRWDQVEKLWSGQQNLVNLREINISDSVCLTELPDLSKASQLQYVLLDYCDSLTQVPSYFQCFENLEVLRLDYCDNLQCFPRRIDSNNFKVLSLACCSNIKKSPQISAKIVHLDLSRTAIEELQQSFSVDLQQSFDDGTIELDLSGCSNITKFPEISGNLTRLTLDGTSIEEVPSSIQFLTNLERLLMRNCKKLSRLPSSICKLKSLEYLIISGCSKLESFPEIMEPLESLITLDLSETAIRDLKSLGNLRRLALDGTSIEEVPSSMQFLTNLERLLMRNCKKLSRLPSSIYGTLIKELPELPPSLKSLAANGCESLEIISTSTLGDSGRQLSFANCFKLDQKALMADMQLKIQETLGVVTGKGYRKEGKGVGSILYLMKIQINPTFEDE
ncbi:unnamed protein product [Dovyalis caffra]|uniref:Uncharacterized protein n=1 Tax=Dovyalis caffra TaxID=77055 RepID=A0AAV1QPL7_9ROSI|nr:unnamed protein product [Dovyalis caffra]